MPPKINFSGLIGTKTVFKITVKIPFKDAQSLDKENLLRDYIIKVSNELPNKIVTKSD